MEGDGLMAAHEAYFDESERKGGVFCVAGYAFLPRQARRFVKEWRAVFDPYGGFHMVDLVSKHEGFEGITNSERDALLKEAVHIVNSRMQFGVAVSCYMDEVRLHSPKWIRGFSHAYPLCCQLSMVALGTSLDTAGIPDGVTYVFESGHAYEAEATDVIKSIVSDPDLKRRCHHEGTAFLPKPRAVPLQAADLLAWEWAKCKDETLDQELRPIRKSLLALSQRDPHRYRVHHITGPKLIKYLGVVRNLGLEQLREQGESRHEIQ